MMLTLRFGLTFDICYTGVTCLGAFWKAAKPDRQGRRKRGAPCREQQQKQDVRI